MPKIVDPRTAASLRNRLAAGRIPAASKRLRDRLAPAQRKVYAEPEPELCVAVDTPPDDYPTEGEDL